MKTYEFEDLIMKLYNTLTKQIEPFKPLNPPEVGLYACGFTVYDYTHLGHLRKYSLDDVLVRTLKHAGYQVTFVQNVTDVGHLTSDADSGEDKLIKGARKYQQTVWDVAKKFEDYFFYSMDLMGNLRPDVSCRATEHIEQMLALVKTLEEKGFTYQIPGDGIYFDTAKFADYGKLGNLDLSGLQEGARVEKTQKKNPTDFALWKFERPGENRAMVWPSPWLERSFPGWHIECSAMSMKYLGDQFDIHTGGIDHIPVHHQNEIAQSEAATGKKPFVKYWIHHNHLMVEGEKMSKSKGNFFTIDDVLQRGFEAQALRLLFLQAHYRSQQNFTWKSLKAAQTSWDKFKAFYTQLAQVKPKTLAKLSTQAQEYLEQFFALMEDDLKTPQAVAVFWQVIESQLKLAEKKALLLEFDQVLGLGLADLKPESTEPVELPPEVKALLAQREQARAAKNWDQADELRDQLQAQGYQVLDTTKGQTVKKMPKNTT